MGATSKTKKIVLAATLSTALAFAGIQAATAAGPGAGKGSGFKGQGPCFGQGQQCDEETLKKHDAFLAETTELRKSIAQKRAEKRAVMANENPDAQKASKLAGELFDLREQMRTKAKAAGLPGYMMMSRMGMGDNSGMNKRGHRGNRGNMGGSFHHGNMM